MTDERAKISKKAHRLTAKKIENLKEPGRYHDGFSLYLQVTPSGAKSWLYRYSHNGRERFHGLGPLRLYPLKQARLLRDEAARLLRTGTDPIDAKREKRQAAKLATVQATTFQQAAQDFIATKEAEWGNAVHRRHWQQTLSDYVYPIIGDLSVAAIDRDLVLKVLKPIWTKKQIAQRLRGRIERILDFANSSGMRSGDNPAKWLFLKDLLPNLSKIRTVKPHAAMPFGDVSAFLAELRAVEGIAARALEVTVLTALRTGEVLGATWSEIDLMKREWIIPAERMKTGKEHKIPLSARVVEIFETLPREDNNPHAFVGERAGKPIGGRAMFALLSEMRPGLTVHGFRSSFRDWAAERTTFDNIVVEMALAHTVGSAVERAYRRGDLFDKRRTVMDAWEKYCTTGEPIGALIQGPWATANV